MIPALLIAGGGAVLLVLIVWVDRAHALTWQQRHQINEFIFDQRDWWRLYNELDRVPYERHFRTVLLGRDPAKLYSADLAAALNAESAR